MNVAWAALRKPAARLSQLATHLLRHPGTPHRMPTAVAPAAATAGRQLGEVTITGVSVRDIRFHTSKDSSGSDARSADPDYSCAYIELSAESGDVGLTGTGLAFTIGRGNETVVLACQVLARFVIGLRLRADIIADFPRVWRALTNDGQLVWIGPEKGPVHQAAAGLLNAMWDLWGKVEGKPVWQLVSEMSPEQIVSLLDFSYVEDVLTPQEATDILAAAAPTRPRALTRPPFHSPQRHRSFRGFG